MSVVDAGAQTITYRIAYYGPGLCGKSTNLTATHARTALARRSELRNVASETERTLSVILCPDVSTTASGLSVRIELITVPGPVFYDVSRRLILRGADGVIFVADSQVMRHQANLESMENLCANLEANGIDPASVPLVLQYNKRDLGDIVTEAELDSSLNPRNRPRFGAVASRDVGVRETFDACLALVLGAG